MRLVSPFGFGRRRGELGVRVIVRDVQTGKQKGFTVHDSNFLEVLDTVEFGLKHKELMRR